jgi:alpha-galactosidase
MECDFANDSGLLAYPIIITNGVGATVRYCVGIQDLGSVSFPAGTGPLISNSTNDRGSHLGWSTNYVPTGFQFTGPNAVVADGSGLTGVHAATVDSIAGQSYTNLIDQPLSLTVKPGMHRMFAAPPFTINMWLGWPQSADSMTNVAQDFISIFGTNAGPRWICLDDGWQTGVTHDADHFLIPSTNYFPQGMRPVVDYLHSLGFKVGLYLAAPNVHGYNNSYPVQEAQSLAAWDVDYIKFDGMEDGTQYLQQFAQTIDTIYLSANRVPIFIMAHVPNTGLEAAAYNDPAFKSLVNSHFSTPGDIRDDFLSTMTGYAEVGTNHAYFSSMIPEAASHVGLLNYPPTATNDAIGVKAELGLQAMLSSVRQTYLWDISGGHIVRPPDAVIAALTNADVWAVNQDAAQVVGWPISITSSNQIWVKPLGSPTGPEWAVCLWNALINAGQTQAMSFSLGSLPQATRPMWARDLWSGGTQLVSGLLTVTNQPCELKMFRLSPYQTSDTPLTTNITIQAGTILTIKDGLIIKVSPGG